MALTLVKNIGLSDAATTTRTSLVCEPTTAASKLQLMMTGNWFACTSANGGTSWTQVDPFTRFPASAGGFCCDQVVLFHPQHRIWIWLLQYSAGAGGGNLFRLAISREASFGSWYYWDFRPTDLNASWTTTWFDYPDMAFTNQQLFITFNAFIGNAWQRSVVFRLPLTALASGTGLSYRWWTTTTNGSIRLCRGATSVMYMGSHNSLSQMRVYQWPDTAVSISSSTVNVRAWSAGTYSAPGPGGVNWLNRLDPRVTGAWVGAGVIGFMWSANRDASHPLPYIRVVRLNEASKALLNEPDIWSNNAAWAYPAAAANAQGQVGFAAFYGGGAIHPGHVVGIQTAAGWQTTLTRTSTHGPADQAWGDYLSVLAHHDQSSQWVASGYTLQGGNARQNIEPRHVQFRA